MSIHFAGEPLLLETPELREWMKKYLPPRDLRMLGEHPALASNRTEKRSCHSAGVGLGRPNYPEPPEFGINTLYWPTGASRWSQFYGLATKTSLDKILGKITSQSPAARLLIDDERPTDLDAHFIAVDMYMLPPRQLSCVPKEEQIWLLPLVDVRWWWQFASMPDDFEVTANSTWLGVINGLAASLGVTITSSTAHGDYGYPDPIECSRSLENAAVMLDAVAHSIGQRIVRWTNGRVLSLSQTASKAHRLFNVKGLGPWSTAAGGDSIGQIQKRYVPSKVRVVFRRGCDSAYEVDTTPEEAMGLQIGAAIEVPGVRGGKTQFIPVPGFEWTVHTSAYAEGLSGDPTNLADMQDLAFQVTLDYYAHLEGAMDQQFNAIKLWNPTGFDDHVLWSFGTLHDYGYTAQTRVQSPPYNFGVEEMVHQIYETPLDCCFGGLIMFRLEEELCVGGRAEARIVDPGTLTTRAGATIIVVDDEGKFFGRGVAGVNGSLGGDDLDGCSVGWAQPVIERLNDDMTTTDVIFSILSMGTWYRYITGTLSLGTWNIGVDFVTRAWDGEHRGTSGCGDSSFDARFVRTDSGVFGTGITLIPMNCLEAVAGTEFKAIFNEHSRRYEVFSYCCTEP